MPVYIVCHKKRNNPRMDARICELKCSLKHECKEFNAYHKSDAAGETASGTPGSAPVRLGEAAYIPVSL